MAIGTQGLMLKLEKLIMKFGGFTVHFRLRKMLIQGSKVMCTPWDSGRCETAHIRFGCIRLNFGKKPFCGQVAKEAPMIGSKVEVEWQHATPNYFRSGD